MEQSLETAAVVEAVNLVLNGAAVALLGRVAALLVDVKKLSERSEEERKYRHRLERGEHRGE